MELGEKLRQARLEAGLSQRQLCDGCITRNMLSQIENGSAKPSMKTLAFLAERLGKSVSYFLEETAVLSPNQSVMESARRLYDDGAYEEAALVLDAYRQPDPVYDRERQLLWCLTHLALAEDALKQGRKRYAVELLEKAAVETAYCREALERRRLLLLGSTGEKRVSGYLPSLDEELLLRAEEALDEENNMRAAQLLDAAENQTTPRWNLLRGRCWMAEKAYNQASVCFHRAEEHYPEETAVLLEICYRELGNFKQAYTYACKQKRK